MSDALTACLAALDAAADADADARDAATELERKRLKRNSARAGGCVAARAAVRRGRGALRARSKLTRAAVASAASAAAALAPPLRAHGRARDAQGRVSRARSFASSRRCSARATPRGSLSSAVFMVTTEQLRLSSPPSRSSTTASPTPKALPTPLGIYDFGCSCCETASVGAREYVSDEGLRAFSLQSNQ
jgi:hypothetical protein